MAKLVQSSGNCLYQYWEEVKGSELNLWFKPPPHNLCQLLIFWIFNFWRILWYLKKNIFSTPCESWAHLRHIFTVICFFINPWWGSNPVCWDRNPARNQKNTLTPYNKIMDCKGYWLIDWLTAFIGIGIGILY